jgi:hypothetical protein
MINFKTLLTLYPNVTHTIGDDAFDANGNKVEYDINAVNNAVATAQATAATNKANAIAKLTALGLTADEISALGV